MEESDSPQRRECLSSSRIWSFKFGTAEPTRAEREHLERCVRCLALFEAVLDANPPDREPDR